MLHIRKGIVAAVALVAVVGSGCGDDPSYACTQCGDECVYTDMDMNHCGACDNACHPAQTCEYGVCACPGGGEVCGDGCVDTATDPYNCGSCATVCAVGSACTEGVCDAELTAYGTVSVDYSSAYIYDGPMWDMDLDYRWAHFTDGVANQLPTFTGDLGDAGPIPSDGTEWNLTHAEHWVTSAGDPPFVRIEQESFGDASWTIISNPSVRIDFAQDAIAPGTHDLAMLGDAGAPDLYLYDVLDAESGEICILASAHGGSIEVIEATDTTAIEGGTIQVVGTDIPLYHPSSTPLGDLRDEYVALGLSVCPMR